ncbi:uncharacterized protein LOC143997772 [Lithobates pipiens]
MGDSLVLQVSGIPTSLYYKMVRDNLLIHFLRRSNGGDGEVDVRYPTEEEGVAVLTFGQEEVANRVLSWRHQLEMEGYTYPLAVSRPRCRGTQVSKPLMALSLDGTSAGEDGASGSYGRQGYGSVGSRQRKPKDTSSDDSTSINKHPKSNFPANLHWYSKPTKKVPADEDRRPNRSSTLASNGKPADSSELASHVALPGTQFKEDLPDSRQLRHTFAAESCSSQSKPKDNISDGLISNPKFPNSTITDGSDFNSGQPKNTSKDKLNSNPNHSKSTIEDITKFSSRQPKKTSTDEFNSSPNHSKSTTGDSTNGDGTKFSSDQPKKTSTDELSSSKNHSSSSQSKPEDNIADGLISNQKYPNSTISVGSDFNPGQPKNTSTNALNSNQKHSNSTIEGSTKFNSGQPKKTSIDEFNSSPNHSKSSTGDGTKFNSGQPKNTSTDEINSNTSHSKSTIVDGIKFSSGQPKNISTDELNSNPNHSKSTLGNVKPGKPQNSSPDEFHLNPRNLEDLTARPSNPSSLMAAGWSSLSSPTGNSLSAINPKNHLDESSLSTDLLVDPAVHTYVSVFMKDAIDDILSPSDVEITTEKGEGYNRVILTSKSPHLSRLFYKAAHEISDIFIKCQHILRFQSIELSNISADRTKNLQSYLFRCGIWSLADEKRLQMIGPNEDLTRFMEEWTSAGGDFVRFVHSLQGVSPASSRPQVVRMDNVHQSTTHSHNVAHDVQRARPRHHSAESGARGGTRSPNSTNRSNFPFNKSWK